MAMITLYKDKINGVGSLLDDMIKSVNNLDVQLDTLKTTLQGVDSSTCNLEDTLNSISASSKSEKSKAEDLKKLNEKLTDFIAATTKRDNSAREEINKAKEDFYTKYSHLKPECEKSRVEKIIDGMKSACEWCKEHWKLLATIVIVAVSVVLLVSGVGSGVGAVILAEVCKGAIWGAAIGGIVGGLSSLAQGDSFLDGFEDGAFSGAMVGAAFGGLGKTGGLLGEGIKCNSMFGKFIRGTAVATRMVSIGMDGFDTIALVDKTFGKGNIAELNAKLHKSDAYNFFQLGVNVVAVLTVAMTSTMSCFVAGTLVMTAAGVLAIERIKAGDVVLSAHQETFEVGHRKVLETYVREVDRLVHLVVNGETIITTFDHPFYVKDQGFMPATNLWIGAELIDKNGNILHVEEIYHEYLEDETCTVYNFQVEDYHTYFVSEQCIWVHNVGCGGSYGNLKADKKGKLYASEEVHHTPAKKSSNLSKRDGPAIRMEKSDHRKTASCGRSKEAQAYREKQQELINSGKFKEAVQMDIDDIRSKFGDKYDKSIDEMLEYVNELEKEGKI